MAVEFNDLPNRVTVDPKDQTKVYVQEQVMNVEVSSSGPQGIPGPVGPAGSTGSTGPQGPQGEKGTYTVSATAPVSPNVGDTWFNSTTSQMYIRYDGYWVETSSSYLGPANSLSIGTVTTGSAGSSASATITGTAPSQTLNLTIPRGDAGQNSTPPQAVRWSPTFQATGLTFTGTNTTYPTYNSYYVKFGQLVSFNIKINLSTVTNFGTGQFKVDLPFAPMATAANHYSAWCWVNPSQPADDLNGHVQLVADHVEGGQTLDLHWILATTSNPKPVIESLLTQGNPVTLTTSSVMYINGTYISAT